MGYYKSIKRDISNGLSNEEVNIAGSGDFIMLTRKPANAIVKVRFDSNYNDAIELHEWMGIECKNTQKIYITCTPISGQIIEIVQAKNRKEFDIIPPVRNKLNIGTIDELKGGSIDINNMSINAIAAIQRILQVKEIVVSTGKNEPYNQTKADEWQTLYLTQRANFDEADIFLNVLSNFIPNPGQTYQTWTDVQHQMLRVLVDGVVVAQAGSPQTTLGGKFDEKITIKECRGKKIEIRSFFRNLGIDNTDPDNPVPYPNPNWNSWRLQGYRYKYQNETEQEVFTQSFLHVDAYTQDSDSIALSEWELDYEGVELTDKIYIDGLQVMHAAGDIMPRPEFPTFDLEGATLSADNNYSHTWSSFMGGTEWLKISISNHTLNGDPTIEFDFYFVHVELGNLSNGMNFLDFYLTGVDLIQNA